MAWPHVPSEQRGSTGSRTSCHLPPSFALARRYLLRSSAQPDFIEVGISSITIRLPTPGVLGWINILRTSDQFKNLCKLYCLPTIQLQPVTQVQTHRAAPAMPASPPANVCSSFLPSPFQHLTTVRQTGGASKILLSWQPTATDTIS